MERTQCHCRHTAIGRLTAGGGDLHPDQHRRSRPPSFLRLWSHLLPNRCLRNSKADDSLLHRSRVCRRPSTGCTLASTLLLRSLCLSRLSSLVSLRSSSPLLSLFSFPSLLVSSPLNGRHYCQVCRHPLPNIAKHLAKWEHRIDKCRMILQARTAAPVGFWHFGVASRPITWSPPAQRSRWRSLTRSVGAQLNSAIAEIRTRYVPTLVGFPVK